MTHLDEEMVNAYVDREVDEAEVRTHLAECHECALRVIAGTQMKRAVARMRVEAPAGVMDRLQARLQVKEVRRSFGYRWLGLAAALLIAVALGGWWWGNRTNELAAELVDEHLATMAEGAAPQVLSSDRHTVKPWFAGKLPFSFNLPETLPEGTTLVGADLTYVDGRPAALLMFTVGKHKATVLVMQRRGLVELPRMRAGFSLRGAAAGELEMLAVSDVNAGELEGVLEAVVKAQGGA